MTVLNDHWNTGTVKKQDKVLINYIKAKHSHVVLRNN